MIVLVLASLSILAGGILGYYIGQYRASLEIYEKMNKLYQAFRETK